MQEQNTKHENITCFILAGGKSSRMGTDKGLMPFRGSAMIEHVIRIVLPIFSEVIIMSNQPGYEKFGFAVWEDEVKGLGPLGGITTALRNTTTALNFFISCDLPDMDAEIIRMICNTEERGAVTLPTHHGHLEPLCALYSTEVLPIFEGQIRRGNLRMHDAVAQANAVSVAIPESFFAGRNPFGNFNTTEDTARDQ